MIYMSNDNEFFEGVATIGGLICLGLCWFFGISPTTLFGWGDNWICIGPICGIFVKWFADIAIAFVVGGILAGILAIVLLSKS